MSPNQTLKKHERAFIYSHMSVLDAIKIIDNASLQIALVVRDDGFLLGTVTDGDVRRAILKGIKLEDSVVSIMMTNPTTVAPNTPSAVMTKMMSDLQIHQIPVVDDNNIVIDLCLLDDYLGKGSFEPIPNKDVWVILMLGGKGTRLHPLTERMPKPMLSVGGKPLLETIMENFIDQGFKKFFFSVNFMAEIIEDHFKDGSQYGAEIFYLHETLSMGTAGALSLLPQRPSAPVIVMNGDILTNNNFSHLVSFHQQNQAVATMCVREYQQQVPYGIVQTDGTKLTSIVEKPIHSYFVNAGIYMLDPLAIDIVPKQSFYDMPQLFEAIATAGHDSAVFPIRDYWKDIGRIEDLEVASDDFKKIFG